MAVPLPDARQSEERLAGGLVADAVRVGDTVRRAQPESADFVADLLRFFEHIGWPGAPRYRGVDDQDRQILTYVDGHAAWDLVQPPGVHARASLRRVAVLVRQFHDLTAGSWLADGHEVVCHRDLAPTNTVYRDTGAGLRPVAFLDWDEAAPGERLDDLAQVCWRYADLGPHRTPASAAQLLRIVADGYALADRGTLVDALLDYQRGVRETLEAEAEERARAEEGDAPRRPTTANGVLEEVRAAEEWAIEHRDALAAGLD